MSSRIEKMVDEIERELYRTYVRHPVDPAVTDERAIDVIEELTIADTAALRCEIRKLIGEAGQDEHLAPAMREPTVGDRSLQEVIG